MDSPTPTPESRLQLPRFLRRTSGASTLTTESLNASNVDINVPQHAHGQSTTVNESPTLHRAGLLQSRSYNPSSLTADVMPHSQNSIRLSTVQLSNMMLPQRASDSDATGNTNWDWNATSASPSLPNRNDTAQQSTSQRNKPSGLSLLRQEYESDHQGISDSDPSLRLSSTKGLSLPTTTTNPPSSSSTSPVAETMVPPARLREEFLSKPSLIRWDPAADSQPYLNESTPLLRAPSPPNYSSSPPPPSSYAKRTFSVIECVFSRQNVEDTTKTALKSIPAVLLGSLLNILDGISYGMIIFPAVGVFAGLGPMGVSMFFLSAFISQLCYTLGGSSFAGANGSMMIEVVPFFHILANSIATIVGEDHPEAIVATTLVSFAFSSILTGLSFLLFGALKLGVILSFVPRHILVGCIGGVGAFLIETGLTVSMRIDDDDFQMNWETFKFMFLDTHNLVLWVLPLFLAVLLRIITHKWNHQLVFPLYFILIPMIFYIVVAAARLNLGDLRADGWLFDISSGADETWYKFYTLLDLKLVRWEALWLTLPTQFALLFFNILHPPLNVPALSVSLDEDVDTNKELVAHGYSNILAGLFGTVPNYLVYVNTLLFYRVGGTTRISGFLLAIANAVLLLVGTGPIAYIPVIVVGALIFVLGIDLVKEALWDTRHRVSRTEYFTIISIMVAMTVWDFVIGVLFGIVVCCFFFVVQNSQGQSIRAILTGESVVSTVRRPSSHRAYIKDVSKQTCVLRLQGYLFFGTITHVESAIRDIVDGQSWLRQPVRFLVLDLSLVAGVDMSSAEAFVRIQRLLSAKYITLVFCGFSAESSVGKALQSVGVLSAPGVETFLTFNDATEWTENAYLKAWFKSQKVETVLPFVLPGRQDADMNYEEPYGSVLTSPRITHLHEAGIRTIATELAAPIYEDAEEPHNTIFRAFSSFGEVNFDQLRSLASYLQRMSLPEGHVLWRQGDASDGLYIIETGVLRASYQFNSHSPAIEESMVPGTLAGELSALSGLPRNATVTVERPAIVWKLSIENLRRLETEEPALSKMFLQLVLKAAKIDYDILLSALATRH